MSQYNPIEALRQTSPENPVDMRLYKVGVGRMNLVQAADLMIGAQETQTAKEPYYAARAELGTAPTQSEAQIIQFTSESEELTRKHREQQARISAAQAHRKAA